MLLFHIKMGFSKSRHNIMGFSIFIFYGVLNSCSVKHKPISICFKKDNAKK